MFSDRVYGNLAEDVRGNPPFQPSLFNLIGASETVSSLSVPQNLSLNPVVPNGSGIFPDLFAPNIKPPRVVTWNFGMQREITHNLTIDVNYVGNHGTRILRVLDANPPQPALVNQLIWLWEFPLHAPPRNSVIYISVRELTLGRVAI